MRTTIICIIVIVAGIWFMNSSSKKVPAPKEIPPTETALQSDPAKEPEVEAPDTEESPKSDKDSEELRKRKEKYRKLKAEYKRLSAEKSRVGTLLSKISKIDKWDGSERSKYRKAESDVESGIRRVQNLKREFEMLIDKRNAIRRIKRKKRSELQEQKLAELKISISRKNSEIKRTECAIRRARLKKDSVVSTYRNKLKEKYRQLVYNTGKLTMQMERVKNPPKKKKEEELCKKEKEEDVQQ